MEHEIKDEFLKKNVQYDEKGHPYVRLSDNKVVTFSNLPWIDNLLCNLDKKKENLK